MVLNAVLVLDCPKEGIVKIRTAKEINEAYDLLRTVVHLRITEELALFDTGGDRNIGYWATSEAIEWVLGHEGALSTNLTSLRAMRECYSSEILAKISKKMDELKTMRSERERPN